MCTLRYVLSGAAGARGAGSPSCTAAPPPVPQSPPPCGAGGPPSAEACSAAACCARRGAAGCSSSSSPAVVSAAAVLGPAAGWAEEGCAPAAGAGEERGAAEFEGELQLSRSTILDYDGSSRDAVPRRSPSSWRSLQGWTLDRFPSATKAPATAPASNHHTVGASPLFATSGATPPASTASLLEESSALLFLGEDGEEMVCEGECLEQKAQALDEDQAAWFAEHEAGASRSAPSGCGSTASLYSAEMLSAFPGPTTAPPPVGIGPHLRPRAPDWPAPNTPTSATPGPGDVPQGYSLGPCLAHLSRVGRITAHRLRAATADSLSDPVAAASAAAAAVSALPDGGGLGSALWVAAGVGSMLAAAKGRPVGGQPGGADVGREAAVNAEAGPKSKEGFGCKVAAVLADAIAGYPSASAKLAARRRMRALVAGVSLAWTAVNLASALAALDPACGPASSTQAVLDLACNLPDLSEVGAELMHVAVAAGLAVGSGARVDPLGPHKL
ncbi:hypothetical protein HYH03_005548 [Edaphochlamys debaryana]|uniref:Uncharacterized protein n=1 Tax=Edaphochlamys debaryana TaxID=47281 RepID=A0A836C0X4_9CHLO|nr:hypothetical protein HYH03_005548 [Edaphochlamys debaryana]|eukprot:KAG2496316.1 hypothetical protein HYH03_005548 [Edaphochlamys debaryana]